MKIYSYSTINFVLICNWNDIEAVLIGVLHFLLVNVDHSTGNFELSQRQLWLVFVNDK